MIGRQLYGSSYMSHKSFRADLWKSLFSYSTQVSSERKFAKFYPPTSTTTTPYIFQAESFINIECSLPTNQVEQANLDIEHK